MVGDADAVFDYFTFQRRTANFWWLLAITVLFGWMSLVGVVRAGFYVLVISTTRAAQALGVSDRRSSCVICCLMPWSRPSPFTVYFMWFDNHPDLARFLGFGLPLGSPSLGELLLLEK